MNNKEFSAGTKVERELKLIDLTSGPTIGNTIVSGIPNFCGGKRIRLVSFWHYRLKPVLDDLADKYTYPLLSAFGIFSIVLWFVVLVLLIMRL